MAVLDPTFERLSRAFLETSRRFASDRIVAGSRPGLRYAAVGSSIPGFNRLVATTMSEATVDDDLDAALADLDRFPVLSAWIPAGAVPGDLTDRFGARGFVLDDEAVPAMTADLAAIPAIEPAPGVTWSRVVDLAAMAAVIDVMSLGFEMPDSLRPFFEHLLSGTSLSGDDGLGVFLVALEGRPVSTALGGVVGDAVAIYNVATVPDARGQGLGRLATLLAMHHGAAGGATVAVLESSEMGYTVYARLGFRDVGRYQVLVRRREGATEG